MWPRLPRILGRVTPIVSRTSPVWTLAGRRALSVSPMTQDHSRDITRLTYHSRKRGILETTLIFSAFADARLAKLSARDLADYEAILTCNTWSEWDLYHYLVVPEDRLDAPQDLKDRPVFWMVREMVHQQGGVVKCPPTV